MGNSVRGMADVALQAAASPCRARDPGMVRA